MVRPAVESGPMVWVTMWRERSAASRRALCMAPMTARATASGATRLMRSVKRTPVKAPVESMVTWARPLSSSADTRSSLSRLLMALVPAAIRSTRPFQSCRYAVA